MPIINDPSSGESYKLTNNAQSYFDEHYQIAVDRLDALYADIGPFPVIALQEETKEPVFRLYLESQRWLDDAGVRWHSAQHANVDWILGQFFVAGDSFNGANAKLGLRIGERTQRHVADILSATLRAYAFSKSALEEWLRDNQFEWEWVFDPNDPLFGRLDLHRSIRISDGGAASYVKMQKVFGTLTSERIYGGAA